MWNGVNVEGKTFGEATDEQYVCMDPQNGDKSLACVNQFAEFLCLMKIRGSEKYNFKWKKTTCYCGKFTMGKAKFTHGKFTLSVSGHGSALKSKTGQNSCC